MSSTIDRPLVSAASADTSLLTVGPWDRGELAILRNSLDDDFPCATLPDCSAAIGWLETTAAMPAVILLGQLLPGMHDQADVEALRQSAPLAQIVIVAGTWCEGELRTGKPIAGVLRLYWYELLPWWRAWLDGQVAWTAGLDGQFTSWQQRSHHAQLRGLVAIHSRTLATFDAIAGALRQSGLECCWIRDPAEVPGQLTHGLWDGGQLDPTETTHLQLFAARVEQAGGSLIVLLDFPRKEHVALLREIGCQAYLGKPYRVDDLIWLAAESC